MYHSYISNTAETSTSVTTNNQLPISDKVFALPTVQSVQTLNKDFESDIQLSIPLAPNEQPHPPILVVDDELPNPTAFLVEPVKGGQFKLYSNDANRQEYAGLYYNFEVAYFLKHWPRPLIPIPLEKALKTQKPNSIPALTPDRIEFLKIQITGVQSMQFRRINSSSGQQPERIKTREVTSYASL